MEKSTKNNPYIHDGIDIKWYGDVDTNNSEVPGREKARMEAKKGYEEAVKSNARKVQKGAGNE